MLAEFVFILFIYFQYLHIQTEATQTFKDRCEALTLSKYYRHSCFVYHTTPAKVWQAAFEACTDMEEKGFLATVIGEELLEVLNTFLYSNGGTQWTWTGMFRNDTSGNVKDGWYYIGADGWRMEAPKGIQGGWRLTQPTTSSYYGACFYPTASLATGGLQERHITAHAHRFLCQYDDAGQMEGGRKFSQVAKEKQANDTTFEYQTHEWTTHRLNCAKHCAAENHCRSYAYSNTEQRCVIYAVEGKDAMKNMADDGSTSNTYNGVRIKRQVSSGRSMLTVEWEGILLGHSDENAIAGFHVEYRRAGDHTWVPYEGIIPYKGANHQYKVTIKDLPSGMVYFVRIMVVGRSGQVLVTTPEIRARS